MKCCLARNHKTKHRAAAERSGGAAGVPNSQFSTRSGAASGGASVVAKRHQTATAPSSPVASESCVSLTTTLQPNRSSRRASLAGSLRAGPAPLSAGGRASI